ncbi:MAG TPA: hypothetical protein VJ739_02010 [Gemmataceae bacterium]|nr:hypothetical protein [Gemmataceae bacterium]
MRHFIISAILAATAVLASQPAAHASWLSEAIHRIRGDYDRGYAPGYGYYGYAPAYGPYGYGPGYGYAPAYTGGYAPGYGYYREPYRSAPDYGLDYNDNVTGPTHGYYEYYPENATIYPDYYGATPQYGAPAPYYDYSPRSYGYSSGYYSPPSYYPYSYRGYVPYYPRYREGWRGRHDHEEREEHHKEHDHHEGHHGKHEHHD